MMAINVNDGENFGLICLSSGAILTFMKLFSSQTGTFGAVVWWFRFFCSAGNKLPAGRMIINRGDKS